MLQKRKGNYLIDLQFQLGGDAAQFLPYQPVTQVAVKPGHKAIFFIQHSQKTKCAVVLWSFSYTLKEAFGKR